MGRVVDIDALTIGGLEALAGERGMRLVTREAYEDLRAGRAVRDDGLLTVEALHFALCESGWIEKPLQQHRRPEGEWPCAEILARLRAAPP